MGRRAEVTCDVPPRAGRSKNGAVGALVILEEGKRERIATCTACAKGLHELKGASTLRAQ